MHRQTEMTTMQVVTLSGTVGTPTAIGNDRYNTFNGTPYYLANMVIDGATVVEAIHANKAWRVREYLAEREAGQ